MTEHTAPTAIIPPSGYIANTMALRCQADNVIRLTALDEIIPIIADLHATKQAYVIVSSASNVILPPMLEATLVSPALMGMTVLAEDENGVTLEVMAGENWHDLVMHTVAQGWYGLQNLALIPSWVGAAPVQNIGAYGVQVSDVLVAVRALHLPSLTWHVLSNAECHFSYRDSRFKQQAGDWLIASVTFKLSKIPDVNLNYGDVAQVAQSIAEQNGRTIITPTDVMHAVIAIRQRKIPNPATLPNCGSFFQNPIVKTQTAQALLRDYPNLVNFAVKRADGTPDPTLTKLAAGWLIENAGLKGGGIAPILTHQHHALILTNHAPYRAEQADIAAAMHLIQTQVQTKFGVWLEPEPVWIGTDGAFSH